MPAEDVTKTGDIRTSLCCAQGRFLFGCGADGDNKEDPGAAARLLKEYAKENEALEVRALSIGGQLLAAGAA